MESPAVDASCPARSSTPAMARTSASTSTVSKHASSLALFGTRVFLGISRDITLQYWVNPQYPQTPSPIH
jgi:hypothetical protein